MYVPELSNPDPPAALMAELNADPELADVFVECAVLIDLIAAGTEQEASDRVDGWSTDFRGAACLVLAAAAAPSVMAARAKAEEGR